MNALPAARPPASSKASIPPPSASWRMATSRWGWLCERRVIDAGHAVLTLEPRGECRGRRGVPLHPDRERRDAAQDEERRVRGERRPGVDLEEADRLDQLAPAD